MYSNHVQQAPPKRIEILITIQTIAMNAAGMEMITTWTKTENWFVCAQNVRLVNLGRMNKCG